MPQKKANTEELIARINAWLTDPRLRRDPGNAARLLEAARDGLDGLANMARDSLDSLATIRRGCAAAAGAVGGAGVLGILAAAQENLRGHDARVAQGHDAKVAQGDRMRLLAPLCPECGKPANGTLERLAGRAEFDGAPGLGTDVGYSGFTDVWWDEQRTALERDGEPRGPGNRPMVCCANGHVWPTAIDYC
jgi:hypothetical protein